MLRRARVTFFTLKLISQRRGKNLVTTRRLDLRKACGELGNGFAKIAPQNSWHWEPVPALAAPLELLLCRADFRTTHRSRLQNNEFHY